MNFGIRRLLAISVAPFLALAIVGCDVDVEDKGKLPDVDVEGGEAPELDVRGPDVDVEAEKETIEVPDVDVETEEKEVTVPDVDVDLPEEDDK